jgi:uncharacterized protein YjbI with pentapeptide repeats
MELDIRVLEAWQTYNTARGFGNNGVATALAFLASQGVSLSGINRPYAYLHGVDLRYADLRRAKLPNADLSEAMLLGADMRQTNLMKVSLVGANLQGTNLTLATVSGADLRAALYNDSSIRLPDGTLLSATEFPEGFNPRSKGLILRNTIPE